MLRFVLAFVFVSGILPLAAQHRTDDYYPYAEEMERVMLPESDTTLFYRAIQRGEGVWDAVAQFNLPQVRIGRRGESFFEERAEVDGIDLSYRYFTLLRLLGAEEIFRAGSTVSASSAGGSGGVRSFGFEHRIPMRPYRIALSYSDRNYRGRLRLVADGELGGGWSGAAVVDGILGRDASIDGVFSEGLSMAFRLRKSIGEEGEVALTALIPATLRSGRTASTAEVFTLTGDRYYNPAWGYQAGKVRSARVRREVVPMVWLKCALPLSDLTSMRATAGIEGGLRAQSGLGWYNARTPMPDNYRYLPSFTEDLATEDAWLRGDTRFTQIAWDELIRQNRLSRDGAVYAVEDRVEHILNLHLGAQFRTQISPSTEVWYEVAWRRAHSRMFKRMRDLLGAEYLLDIDQYLIDDDSYSNKLQNDLRHPNRRIGTGDEFGYDYSLTEQDFRVGGGLEFRANRWSVFVAGSVDDYAVHRRGHYEKELFPGDRSYGRSRRVNLTPYQLKLRCGYAFSPKSYVELGVATLALAPRASDLFVQPQYNNRVIDAPALRRVHSAEVNYHLARPAIEVEASAFVQLSLDESDRMATFDDTSATFADVVVSGIGRMAWGVEAATRIRLSYRWNLNLAGSWGRYTYVRDPRVEVLSDVDHTPIDQGAVSHLKDCRVEDMPEVTAVAELAFRGSKGWSARCSVGYCGARYIAPSMLRRTDRVARQAASTEEAQAEFMAQEELGDAFTLNLSLMKCFYFERSMLAINLMLTNLTDDVALYSGYESSRLRRYHAGAILFARPQASRYTYALPRSLRLSLSWRF